MKRFLLVIALLMSLFMSLFMSLSVMAQQTDSLLFDAYLREDMRAWKEHISRQNSDFRIQNLLIEYGLCGYMVDREKKSALPYVQQFKSHIINHKSQLPAGYYEMYMSAVYVYELRLHESVHPVRAMNLAKQATRLAPNDPLVLSYYGTCLFYAPAPFGSKKEALTWFEKAEKFFRAPQYRFCWVREANQMYIEQCKEKLRDGNSNR